MLMTTLTHDNAMKELLELARWYPSPHNGQPIIIKKLSDTTLEIFYDTAKALFATELGYKFCYVGTGVFVEFLEQACHALGHEVDFNLQLTDVDKDAPPYLHSFGTANVRFGARQPDLQLQNLLRQRQTSRLSYTDEKPTETLVDELKKLASTRDNIFHINTDKEKVQDIMWLNQVALFRDIGNKKINAELRQWLRYTDKQARTKLDGLSAKCLAIPGFVLYLVVKLPFLVQNAVSGSVFKKIYLKNMKSVPSIAWMTSTFKTQDDYLNGGRVFMASWLRLAKDGFYLHPYGTIPSHPDVIKAFYKFVGNAEEGKQAWIIFRIGKSDKPPQSYRHTVEDIYHE